MRENDIYEVVGYAEENLYEITYPYGLNIYEQVDSLDPNKDHKKRKIDRRLKVFLIIVLFFIGILIVVLCPLLSIPDEQKNLIANSTTSMDTSNVSKSSENIPTTPKIYLTEVKFPENRTESNKIRFSSRLTTETTEKTSLKSKTIQVDLF